MADGSLPTTKTLLLQATPSSETAPELNKVSALALHSSHHAIANARKITTEGATTADMPGEPETSHSSEQNGPLFKLSTELRLKICRFAIQHALDLVSPPPNDEYKYSAIQTTRGALALLYTCRALRAESIDAMEPLANAAKASLQSEIHTHAKVNADMAFLGGLDAKIAACMGLDSVSLRLRSSMDEIDGVCSVLTFAREADEKMRAGPVGGEKDPARLESQRERSSRVTVDNGQWVLWSSA
jgi:hypothetical protein